MSINYDVPVQLLADAEVAALYRGRRYRDVRLKPARHEPVYIPRRCGNETRMSVHGGMFDQVLQSAGPYAPRDEKRKRTGRPRKEEQRDAV